MLCNKIVNVILFNFVSIWVAVRSMKWTCLVHTRTLDKIHILKFLQKALFQPVHLTRIFVQGSNSWSVFSSGPSSVLNESIRTFKTISTKYVPSSTIMCVDLTPDHLNWNRYDLIPQFHKLNRLVYQWKWICWKRGCFINFFKTPWLNCKVVQLL